MPNHGEGWQVLINSWEQLCLLGRNSAGGKHAIVV
jgi:hypothetical protein